MQYPKKNIVICGPTATGKTAAAMELAQKIDAEIISVDSGQIYRGMDIGTAKPTLEDQEKVNFHLVDICHPDEIFSAADFRERALAAISDIQSRGKKVILTGGTGLYLRALEEGLFEGPIRHPYIREELEREIQEKGLEILHQELSQVDPVAAQAIPYQNRQRLIRALEVYRLTGKPISEFWSEHQSQKEPSLQFVKYALKIDKEELNRRIELRVDRMIEQGLVREVERLINKWGERAPGLKLIGYKEIVGCLKEEAEIDLAVELIKRHTRYYAKRQMTWFKKDPEIQWVERIC